MNFALKSDMISSTDLDGAVIIGVNAPFPSVRFRTRLFPTVLCVVDSLIRYDKIDPITDIRKGILVGADLPLNKSSITISSKSDDIVALLQSLSDDKNKAGDAEQEYLGRWARHVLRLRHGQRAIFPEIALRYPCWDILLMCFLAEVEHRKLCVKQIRSLVDESNTALLRRIDELSAANLVRRERDAVDARRTIIRLTQKGADALLEYIDKYIRQ